MTLDIYKSVISACPLFLRPVIRILLRAGITYKQFTTIARSIFVDVAANEYGINGRKTNTSRIAILTGISRSEVTKIRKNIEREPDEFEHPTVLSNASRILSAWHHDAEFNNSDGEPLILPLDANNGTASFTGLVNKYGGDIPLTAMLKELKKTNSIEALSDGRLKVLTPFFIPNKYDSNKIFSLAETFHDIGETSYHNFVRDDEDPSRFQARAFNNHIPPELSEEFGEMVREKSYDLLQEIDQWLTEKEITASRKTDDKTTSRFGLGVYLIQGNPIKQINEDQS